MTERATYFDEKWSRGLKVKREVRRGGREARANFWTWATRPLLPTELPPNYSLALATRLKISPSYTMLLRHSLKVTQPFTRSLLRPQSTSASSAAAPSSALAHWLEGLPRSTIRQQDHVALTQVQGLVSTLELPEDGLAENWKHGCVRELARWITPQPRFKEQL